MSDSVHIGDDHGVINYVKVLVDHRHHLTRHILFLFDRDAENGCCYKADQSEDDDHADDDIFGDKFHHA